MTRGIRITHALAIAEDAIEERFIRASGPGGQNVNKVATAVQLRVDLRRSSLPEAVQRRLAQIAGKRVSADAVLVITAQDHRTQDANRRAARARLVDLVRRAAAVPKVRRPTKLPRAARERRLEEKARRARKKGLRAKRISLD